MRIAGISIPVRSIVTASGLLIMGTIAWTDLNNVAAENKRVNAEQQEILEKLVDGVQDAEVQRARMQEQQAQMLEVLKDIREQVRRNERRRFNGDLPQ